MKGFERLQTLIGREIGANELAIISDVFGVSMNLFSEEESTEPWKVEPDDSSPDSLTTWADASKRVINSVPVLDIVESLSIRRGVTCINAKYKNIEMVTICILDQKDHGEIMKLCSGRFSGIPRKKTANE